MKTFYSLLAAVVAVSGCGFCSGSASAQISITEVSSSNTLGEDWFELTNFGGAAVSLNGFYWDDDGPTGADGALFGLFSIAPGESLIVLEGSELTGGIATTFRAEYGLGTSLQILTEDDFTGPDTFSGLSGGNGDQVELFDTDPNAPGAVFNVIDLVQFGAATAGFSFDVINGVPTVSVSGSNGAITAINGDVGSPGFATTPTAVPEPGSIALLTVLGAMASIQRRRKS